MWLFKILGTAIQEVVRGLVMPVFGGLFRPILPWLQRVFKFQPHEIKRPIVAGLAVIVIAGSGVWIYRTQVPPTPKLNLKPFEGLGTVLAEEVAKRIDDKGEIVLLVARHAGGKIPALDVPVETFRSALKAHSQIQIVATETIDVPAMMMAAMPADQFLACLNRHPRVAAIVSFVGLPPLRESDWEKLPARRPKVLVAGISNLNIKSFFDHDLIQMAILPHFMPRANATEPQTAREWFERYYQIVTSDNVAQLPNFGPSSRTAN